MTPYTDFNYYKDVYFGTVFKEDNSIFQKSIQEATQQINTLTFNRIVAIKFDKLTAFQQDIIKKACCQIADFNYENADILNSTFSSYAINGVSMGIKDGLNLIKVNGIFVQESTYKLLAQTGLTCRNMRC